LGGVANIRIQNLTFALSILEKTFTKNKKIVEMTKLMKIGGLMVAMLLMVNVAQAQKFGYVNSAAVLQDLPAVQQMRSNLEGLQKQLQKKGQQMLTEYQAQEKSAVEKKQQGILAPADEEKILAELQTKQAELVKYEQDMVSQLQTKEAELLQPIYDKVNDAIKAVAKEDGLMFVFDANSGVILYAEENTDITEKVKAKL